MEGYGRTWVKLSKKDSNILRGWSLIIICMSHIVPQLGIWGRIILPSNIAIFVFSSGYGLVLSYKQKGSKYLDGFLKKKVFVKIFLPYFVISSLFIVMKGIIKRGILATDFYVFHNWYVEFTLFVYISFYFIWKLCKTTLMRMVGVGGVSCLYVALCLQIGLTSTWYQGILVLWFGMLVPLFDGVKVEQFIQKNRAWLLSFSILLMGVMNFLTFSVIHFPLSGTIGAEGVCLFTVTSMILIMPLFSDRVKNIRFLLEWLGRNSYYCYLLHIPICRVLAMWIKNEWIQYIFTMLVTTGVIMSINKGKKLLAHHT